MKAPLSRPSQTTRAVFARLAQTATIFRVFTPKANKLDILKAPACRGFIITRESTKKP